MSYKSIMKTLKLMKKLKTHTHTHAHTHAHSLAHARTFSHLSPIGDSWWLLQGLPVSSFPRSNIPCWNINGLRWAMCTLSVIGYGENISIISESLDSFLSGSVWVSLSHLTEGGSVYTLWDRTRFKKKRKEKGCSHLRLCAASELTRGSGGPFLSGNHSPPASDDWHQNNPIFPGQSCFWFLVTLLGLGACTSPIPPRKPTSGNFRCKVPAWFPDLQK